MKTVKNDDVEKREQLSAQIKTALAEVEGATKQVLETEEAKQVAYSNNTAACNRLNTAQKQLDSLIERLKKEAPRDSDWNRPRGRSINSIDGVGPDAGGI